MARMDLSGDRPPSLAAHSTRTLLALADVLRGHASLGPGGRASLEYIEAELNRRGAPGPSHT